ncbi:MAG: phosphate ABC transporter substrate-binding protein [Lachnospiraceae bacterium]
MRKLVKTAAAVMMSAALAMTMLAGCSNGNSNENTSGQTSQQENENDSTAAQDNQVSDEGIDYKSVTGTVAMAGSTSMQKMAQALQEAFMEVAPGVKVTAEFNGSSAGIEALINGSVVIGNASRELKDSEKESGAVENIVAIDGIAVIVDTANTVTDLTKDDLTKIYTGEVTNWKDLGGNDQAIVVIGREAASGTRGAFEELLGIENQCNYSNELDNTGAVMAKVASTAGAIGYVSLDVLDGSVKAVALEGVEATVENVKAGNYFLSRPFVMATLGEISEQSEAVQAFFQFIQSDEGKQVIEKVGLITVD